MTTDLQRLIDRADIAEVVTRLGEWLDGRGGDPADIYDADVIVRSPRGEFHGLQDVIDRVAPVVGDAERTQHVHTDTRITIDGDAAHVVANELVQFFQRGQSPHRSSGLRVAYTVARRPDGWRIAHADITLEWIVGSLPA